MQKGVAWYGRGGCNLGAISESVWEQKLGMLHILMERCTMLLCLRQYQHWVVLDTGLPTAALCPCLAHQGIIWDGAMPC